MASPTVTSDSCVSLMQGTLVRPVARYPGSVATDQSLKVAANRVQTTLRSNISSGDTIITGGDASRLVPEMLLTIDSEIVSISSISGNNLTVVRGFDGTFASSHAAGTTMRAEVDAWHHNALAAEITAIEQALGPNLGNIGGGTGGGITWLTSTNFDFQAQNPGVALAAGANSITLSPVPAGVSGTNTKHYLYVSGGTGAAEACLIIGGTGVAGAPSGTIVIQCANAHTGAWTIQSATKGIQEAEKSLSSGGGKVTLPAGNLQMRAPISFQPNRVFEGMGTATRLIPASASAVVFDANIPVHATTPHYVIADNITFANFVIDGQSYVGINGIIGVRNVVQAESEVYSIVGIRFVNIHFNNIRYAVLMQRVFDVSFEGVRCYANTQIRFAAPTLEPLHHNYEIKFNNFNYHWRTMEGNGGAATLSGEAVLHFFMGELVYIVNSIFELAGGATGMDGICYEGGGEDLSVVNTAILQSRIGVRLAAARFGGVANYPGYIRLLNVSMDGLWSSAVYAEDGESLVAGKYVNNVLINNCLLTNPHPAATNVTVIYVGQWSRYWNIANTQINQLGTAYPQTGVFVGANTDFIYLDNNQIMNSSGPPGGHGLFVASPAGVYGIESTLFFGLDDPYQDAAQGVASAATITLPSGRVLVYISGTATINTINAAFTKSVTAVTLVFTVAGATVSNTGNVKMPTPYVATAFGTLSLEYAIGSGFWVQTGRS